MRNALEEIFRKAFFKKGLFYKKMTNYEGEKYREGDVATWLKKDGEEFLKEVGIKEGQNVLDFGCGEGHYAIPAAKLVGDNGKVFAVDKDEQPLHRLVQAAEERGLKNIEVIHTEPITSLENDLVDFILCYDVVHYVKNRKPLYYELHRVLRKKGILSLYPKHLEDDYPLMELASMKLDDVIKEVEETGFSLKERLSKRLIHDDYYNQGYILNFEKV